MQRPANKAPASGPTITAAKALARDLATGQFIGTDGHGRSAAERRAIAARRAEVARLYPDMTCAEIGAELGWSAPAIWKDVKALGLEPRRAGTRRKYPDPQPRACPNPDCPRRGEPFTPPSWAPEQRYCSHRCSQPNNRTELVRETARRLLTEQHRRAGDEIARLNAAGYLTSSQLAAERKVTISAVSRWIAVGLLQAERRIIEGEPHQLISRDEFNRFNAEEWPRILYRMGRQSSYPPNWRRPARLRWTGRKNGHKGAIDGFEKGGRPRDWPDGAQQRVLEYDKQGHTTREIAEFVFGSERYHMRVWRFLNT
jgi:hypothetical protein